MPQVQALATLHRSAESMWRELGSLQDIARWHPMVAAVHDEGQEPGATWTIETLQPVPGSATRRPPAIRCVNSSGPGRGPSKSGTLAGP